MAKWTNIRLQTPTTRVRLSARIRIFFFCFCFWFFFYLTTLMRVFSQINSCQQKNKQTNKQNKKGGSAFRLG